MNLHEYQSRNRFAACGVPVPDGQLAYSADEVYRIAQILDGVVVIKAQALVTGRNKAGGVRIAHTPSQARDIATEMLNSPLKGAQVERLLVDPYFEAKLQIYMGIATDRDIGKPVVIVSPKTGKAINIELLAQSNPAAVIRTHVDPFLGLLTHQITQFAGAIDLPRQYWKTFHDIAKSLYHCYVKNDAISAEINSLIVTEEDKFLAVNTRMSIDDNALYRHRDLALLHDALGDPTGTMSEGTTKYVKLNGQVACVTNGAGLGMATMDLLYRESGGSVSPAVFFDIGGGATASRVGHALDTILKTAGIKAVLVNIFGGITRCDEVAHGILMACERHNTIDLPIVVRFRGTHAQLGHQILKSDARNHDIRVAHSLEQVIQMAMYATHQRISENE